MTDRIDCLVIGAGVVGLAIARRLAQAGLETVVVEAAALIGSQTSSRNSEVIHAGIYYPQGSLKARLCVSGRELLYRYCAEHGVAHQRCGKLIVATSAAQLPELARIEAGGRANGVHDLAPLPLAEVRELEPALTCVGALASPSTGIVDSHGLMQSLLGELEAAAGMVALASPFEGAGSLDGGGFLVEVGGAEPMRLEVGRLLVNCAGLQASRLARRIEGLAPASIPETYYAKGNYFSLQGRAPFSRLIYPVPEPGGLGVHLTLDLGAQARFGPDVEWIEVQDPINYAVDPARAGKFYDEIRRYWPALPDDSLVPAYAGVRPKISPPGTPAADFVIQGPADHGLAGLIALYGIESPGLTASLALAEHVADLAVAQAAL